MWKIARAWPRVQADGLIRLTTSEYGALLRGGVERVPLRVQPLVRDLPRLELGEERLEPERVLVEDRDRPLHAGTNAAPRDLVPSASRRALRPAPEAAFGVDRLAA